MNVGTKSHFAKMARWLIAKKTWATVGGPNMPKRHEVNPTISNEFKKILPQTQQKHAKASSSLHFAGRSRPRVPSSTSLRQACCTKSTGSWTAMRCWIHICYYYYYHYHYHYYYYYYYCDACCWEQGIVWPNLHLLLSGALQKRMVDSVIKEVCLPEVLIASSPLANRTW